MTFGGNHDPVSDTEIDEALRQLGQDVYLGARSHRHSPLFWGDRGGAMMTEVNRELDQYKAIRNMREMKQARKRDREQREQAKLRESKGSEASE